MTLPAGQTPLTDGCKTPLQGNVPVNRRKGRIMEAQDRNSGRRRRFFKRAAIATMIGGIAAGIGFKAFAQEGGCGWHRCGHAVGRQSLPPGHNG